MATPRLQLRADVRVDFAIQGNFFEFWLYPKHVSEPSWSENLAFKRSAASAAGKQRDFPTEKAEDLGQPQGQNPGPFLARLQ